MNGAQWVVQALRAQGVDTVFGYPGGAIMPVYDALYDGGVEHLLCRHEQGAAMAAIGYARATGKSRRLHRHFRPRRHQPDHRPG
ncbi:Acetolactate synthase isozyme 2 large subunit [Serratia marcescens]|uniref:Acetolactate synthase isozyme 2 large subunit n=1 Tax=Serratia marcescens TaxID=615 RepID=A0A379YA81_SERMA|nr:Acetolactate synthase isozyme 2 large subunit [Serratia marcescens]